MTEAPEEFRTAVAALRSMCPRPEVTLEPIRAPQRLAPWAFAVRAETTGPGDVLASGRLVLLHDPRGQEGWDGAFRVVVYLRAELDVELAGDPALAAVGWSWLTDALEASGAGWTALGGTVTATASTRFGDIGGPSRDDDVELRASWSPTSTELRAHGEAFSQTLSSFAGLPPVGVTLFEQRQGD